MISFFKASIVRLLNAIVLSLIIIGLLVFSIMIGLHSYNATTAELDQKASGFTSLASIALQSAIWNYDAPGQNDIAAAILGDTDVVAIQIMGAADKPPLVTDLNEDFKGMAFGNLVERAPELNFLINRRDVTMEGNTIGQVTIIMSKAKVTEQIKSTSLLIAGFASSLILIMGFLVWVSARRFMAKPLKELESSADNLAHGNLDYPIDTSRIDEIGALAKSFAGMRDAIKKKIEDLHILNSTGETLAGLHDQTEALGTALAVMKKQANVTFGSVYLLKDDDELVVSAFSPEMTEVPEVASAKSFKLGEGVAGLAAQSKAIIYVPDTSTDPNFVALNEGECPRALLCVPMMDGQELFGVMNFSGEVGQVRFSPEDEKFALTIARLTVVTTKNIQMLKVIEEQNRTLEHKVSERTSQLRQKTNDINSMLQNMQQGIFTITTDGTIHPEYSAHLERILEIQDIADQPFSRVLLSHTDIGADQLNQVENAVTSLLGEDAMMFEFNSHLLVREFTKSMKDGRKKTLEIDWAPIMDDHDQIDKLMVTVRDITELRGLQAEAELQKQELEIIGQILAVNQGKFNAFLNTSQTYIAENKKLITGTAYKDLDVLATLFRNMHTIKGNARTYGFKYLTDVVHDAEHTYDELRRKNELSWDQSILMSELHHAEESIEKYKSIYEVKLSGFATQRKGKFIEDALLVEIEALLKDADSDNAAARLEKLKNLIRVIDTETMPTILEGILQALPALARELGKEAPLVQINDNDMRILPDVANMLKDVFTHIFRNSLDHGLETAEERLIAGKPAQGSIVLDIDKDPAGLRFRFHDDGRGLNLARIRHKARETGLLAEPDDAPDEAIAELVFNSGLSTAQNVSEISGRGVGMDAVRQFVHKHGGDVKINLLASAGGDYRPFELEVRLPGHMGVQVC